MPSSGVSDGVQALVTSKYPETSFLAIETSGDGAVNVYSRIQMALFKARQLAEQDLQTSMAEHTVEQLQQRMTDKSPPASWYPKHRCASTAANTVYSLTT